jgi:hypothetical protein
MTTHSAQKQHLMYRTMGIVPRCRDWNVDILLREIAAAF